MHHVSKREIRSYTNCIGVHGNKIFVQNIQYKRCKIRSCLAADQDNNKATCLVSINYYMSEEVQTINKAIQRANNIAIIRIQM